MTSAEAVFLRDELLDLLRRESVSTRRVIEAVPARHLNYQPHAKAMTMRELAWHIAQAEPLLLSVIAQGNWDGIDIDPTIPEAIPEILEHYDRELPIGLEAVRAMRVDLLLDTYDLFGAKDCLARRMFYVPMHSAHHRGQLSAYLRAVGAFVPGVYGWSADEREAAAGKS